MAQNLLILTIGALLCNVKQAAAVNGSTSGNAPFTYTSGSGNSINGGIAQFPIKSSNYEYTGMGAAESTIDILSDGSLAYSPALTTAGTGYAQSFDNGTTWKQILPGGSAQPRTQPIFRQEDGRLFYWSSNPPGLMFEYSDDNGKTFSAPLNGSHFDYEIQDWAKLVTGKPVHSQLTNGAAGIMYLSAPAFISTPIPLQPLGPEFQHIMKSTDKGNTWTVTAGAPTLQPVCKYYMRVSIHCYTSASQGVFYTAKECCSGLAMLVSLALSKNIPTSAL